MNTSVRVERHTSDLKDNALDAIFLSIGAMSGSVAIDPWLMFKTLVEVETGDIA